MGKWAWVAGGVLAVGLVAGSGAAYVAWDNSQACAPEQANADAAPNRAGATDGPTAFILGDSYATGWGLDDPADSFAYTLATAEGWDATVAGFPGTGYTIDGNCGDNSFDQRLTGLSSDAEVVVIEGGLNDAIFDAEGASTAAAELLSQVAATAPDADIIVVGVPRVEGKHAASIEDTDAALKSAAENAGATFVDLSAVPIVTTDGTHADAATHAAIASLISKTIAATN